MRENQMSIEAGAAGLGLKALGLPAAFLGFVTFLAVLLGFTVVPPTPGHVWEDVRRRLGAGVLCAPTLGLVATFKFASFQPDYIPFCLHLVGASDQAGDPKALYAYVIAATPFFAMAAIFGFWIVAAGMRYWVRRQDKDLAEIVRDIKSEVHP